MFRKVLFTVAASALCMAQRVWLGGEVGARTTADVSGSADSESRWYVAGPSLSVELGRGFAVSAGLLYHRFGYRTGDGGFFGSFASSTRANVWELPLLVERRFAKGPTGRPFVIAGYSPRWILGREHSEGFSLNPGTGERSNYAFDAKWLPGASHGLAAGGGLEYEWRRIRILPQVRYMRWNRDVIDLQGSHGFHVNAAQNEVRAMVGIRFR